MQKIGPASRSRTMPAQTIPLASMRFNDCARRGLALRSIPSSDFAATPISAIASCFAVGTENSLIKHKIDVESAAPEFMKLQPANKEVSGVGFTNKYNTYSILNELRWALDPDAVFPRESIVPVTNTTWYDPPTNPDVPRSHYHPRLGGGLARPRSTSLRQLPRDPVAIQNAIQPLRVSPRTPTPTSILL